MSTLENCVTNILIVIAWFFGIKGDHDQYLPIGASPRTDDSKVIPFARENEIPYLGEDHKALIYKVERMYTDDTNRCKWLMAIHKMRSNKTGWILDKNHSDEPFKKWGTTGLTSTACLS